jgi:hydroxyacid-oxoacid transhydrogenase
VFVYHILHSLSLNVPQAVEALQQEGVPFQVYDRVAVEPTDKSWLDAIEWARKNDFSHFLA